jgi:hypothetical protein
MPLKSSVGMRFIISDSDQTSGARSDCKGGNCVRQFPDIPVKTFAPCGEKAAARPSVRKKYGNNFATESTKHIDRSQKKEFFSVISVFFVVKYFLIFRVFGVFRG